MDALPIVYHIETAQQFWSGEYRQQKAMFSTHSYGLLELDEILRLLPNATLSALDSALKRFINLCSAYHGAQLTRCTLWVLLNIVAYWIFRAVLAESTTTRACNRPLARLGTLRISFGAHG